MKSTNGLAQALIHLAGTAGTGQSQRQNPDRDSNEGLYDDLLGSWHIESCWFDESRSGRTGRGEWHFAAILGGLGIQDVLFSEGAPETMRGTTLRCYDQARDLWHVTWMQPGGGEFAHLLGRRDGDGIVQTGEPGLGQEKLRWSFWDLEPESFRWTGERTEDGGATWILEQEMKARRMGGAKRSVPWKTR